jgi:hypothetical protein
MAALAFETGKSWRGVTTLRGLESLDRELGVANDSFDPVSTMFTAEAIQGFELETTTR